MADWIGLSRVGILRPFVMLQCPRYSIAVHHRIASTVGSRIDEVRAQGRIPKERKYYVDRQSKAMS